MSHQLHRLAFISTHTSPLAQPGATKAGGMNVYIRELTRQLGHLGYQVDIFTRRDDPDAPEEVRCADKRLRPQRDGRSAGSPRSRGGLCSRAGVHRRRARHDRAPRHGL